MQFNDFLSNVWASPIVKQNSISLPEAGMSEIPDRAQAAPAKSRKFRDNGLPVSG